MDKPAPPQPEHGLVSTYNNWGCRCDECRAASTAYHRDARERRAAALLKPTPTK